MILSALACIPENVALPCRHLVSLLSLAIHLSFSLSHPPLSRSLCPPHRKKSLRSHVRGKGRDTQGRSNTSHLCFIPSLDTAHWFGAERNFYFIILPPKSFERKH
ncbi:hypothetical protein GDO81_018083 [Engystomops pustulosus]|uniref:Secreted protein n=1 Tax=Engystomops pustulosus TaxID=76066 RepID=A0AAV7AAE8_ENGPU|nr:hypothetical protein GDO81_018083 [Engystomops pustulosus]